MATKTIPGNPNAKPDPGPSRKPPMGTKPMAKAGNGNKAKPGKRTA